MFGTWVCCLSITSITVFHDKSDHFLQIKGEVTAYIRHEKENCNNKDSIHQSKMSLDPVRMSKKGLHHKGGQNMLEDYIGH